VDTDAALKVLGGGLAGSKVLDQKGQKMLDRNFDPGFRLALHHKDLGIVTSAAREANVSIPLGAVVAQLVAATVNQGDGGLDHSGLFKQVLHLSGRTSTLGLAGPAARDVAGAPGKSSLLIEQTFCLLKREDEKAIVSRALRSIRDSGRFHQHPADQPSRPRCSP
jgi:hypothetical protein